LKGYLFTQFEFLDFAHGIAWQYGENAIIGGHVVHGHAVLGTVQQSVLGQHCTIRPAGFTGLGGRLHTEWVAAFTGIRSQTGVSELLIAKDDGGFVGGGFCPVGDPVVEVHCERISGFENSPASALLQF
jgi:hypothetical protein